VLLDAIEDKFAVGRQNAVALDEFPALLQAVEDS
jgi:hypothetical protein